MCLWEAVVTGVDTMKILGSEWMCENLGPTIGVVAVEMPEGWIVCIGFAPADESKDEQYVAAIGERIYNKRVATGWFPFLEPDKFISE